MHARAQVLFGMSHMSVVFKFAHLFEIKGSICQLSIADQQSTTETNPQNRRPFFLNHVTWQATNCLVSPPGCVPSTQDEACMGHVQC